MRFDEDVEDQGKEKTVVMSTEAIGTAANSTKVLSSGKVVGKPATNHVKQEWMQARKKKYQKDNRGHIVDNKQGKEADKGKGKDKLEEVATKNKFSALEVEEVHQPTLQITEVKGEDHSNGKKKEHGEKQSKKRQEKEKEGNIGVSSPNPNASGVRVEKDANTKLVGEGNQQELKREKKEAVEKVLEDQHNGNLAKANSIVPSDQSTDERANKESTIDWVHRRFGTSKEELRQLNVTTNQSCQDIPSQTFAQSEQLEDLDQVGDGTVGSDQNTGNGKGVDINRKDISEQTATVIPGLGNVYEQQFKMMQTATSSMENSKEKADEQAIVPRAYGEIEEVPM
ncbi:hypothetical protein A4A49_20226 [Nicotiana attenuata]|uniref:Uncharacterized protein n=1 Tax=Nicotiana attenuata TaxID=49451 RepID=A0A1J6IPP8_NICAT|nr:hypothetical protein A4A49_20226 [Nicotiana attenuata]